MNLKEGRGRVPIRNTSQHEATPYLLVNFPSRNEFDVLYAKHKSTDLKDRYWQMLTYRSQGHSLAECGNLFGISRERVRQIEARFQRKVGISYTNQLEANLATLSKHQQKVESFLNSEMHGKFLPSDDSH
jgi:DNA-binding CsgD family transcriptional regulator